MNCDSVILVLTDRRFSEAPELNAIKPRHRGKEYGVEASNLLDMTDISVKTIQACVLLGTISFAGRRLQSEALYYSIANRLALILGLPHRPAATVIERQVNLRIWWTLYMIDIWSSTGLHLPRQIGFSEHTPLPCEEPLFLRFHASTQAPDHALLVPGIWGEMVHLAHIWTEIHEVDRKSVV